ncbi:hypothetical protein IPV08_11135 [Methylobacterium sp. SD274]|uniref:hypothetical protein n=1 Tax=Methylobacterium sp. SD274 TaxID=2782009 RepID=UPI001A97CB96|nr:hypothetical protein [Methylobacterium sp. SD274]MBO1020524.1 hypothetical protein [Methylobacterium sp. SD274]
MQIKTFAVAAALTVSLSGAAFAQTAAGGASAEGNMNNPGSVKSNSEKGMERMGGGASTTGSTAAPGMTRDVPSNATPGAPAGSNGGNAATGSGAAPSGK